MQDTIRDLAFPGGVETDLLVEPAIEPIRFDTAWEGKVADRILHNLAILLEAPIKTLQDLNRYRKSLSVAS